MQRAKYWCAVPGCNSDGRKDPQKYPFMKDVNFLPFPTKKDARKRRKWLNVIRRPLDYDPKPWHRVCSRHFSGSDCPELFPWNNYGDDAPTRAATSILKRNRQETQDVDDNIEENGDNIVGEDVLVLEDVPDYSEEIIIDHNSKPGEFQTLPDHTYHGDKEYDSVTLETTAVQTDITLEDMDKIFEQKESPLMSTITSSDKKVQFYTGFPNLSFFFGIFGILQNISMKYYTGKDSITEKRYEFFGRKPGPKRKLSKLQEYTLTLVRLRHNLPVVILADLFHVSPSRVSNIFTTWIIHMSLVFSKLLIWPSRTLVTKHMPKSIKTKFPKLRAIIDCTEVFIQKPKRPNSQSKTYSAYKSHNTSKVLVSITPSGAFNFISDTWGGNTSDRYITMHSGFLDKISPRDEIMADRGFLIKDLLTERHAYLTIPPFTRKCSWGKGKTLNAREIRRTRNIANIRIHVERAIQRLKTFKMLSGVIEWTLKPLVNPMLKVSAFLCNLMKPLVTK